MKPGGASIKLWWLAPGAFALAFIAVLVGLPLLALLQYADVGELFAPFSDPWLRRVIVFSWYQATLSTVLSILLAIPVARALSRRSRFPGRQLLLKLFSVSLIVPTIVAVFGIVAVYGKSGWVNTFLAQVELGSVGSIYGLGGILLAHVFFNLPLSVRVLLLALDSIPQSNWKLASQLGMSRWQRFRLLEWHVLKLQLPGLIVLVFSLCFTSFAIVMTLGGGPRATTIEVAIYQALRFDFDLGTAVTLASLQFLFCLLIMLLATLFQRSDLLVGFTGVSAQRFERDSLLLRVVDALVIGLAFLFVLLPLGAIGVSALNASLIKVLVHQSTLLAILNTLWVAILSGLLATVLGCSLIQSSRHLSVRLRSHIGARSLEMAGLVILIIPPLVLGTGLFLLLRPYADVFSIALVLVVLVNALMGLPFVLRVVAVPATQNLQKHDRLCASLGMSGLQRLRLVEWPVLRKPLGLAMAIATALSAGDLTVIALFGSERMTTLPLLLYQRMGSYRMLEASATALVLLVICIGLFWLIERLVGGRGASA